MTTNNQIKTSEYSRGYSKAKQSSDELIEEIIKQERDKFQKQIKELQTQERRRIFQIQGELKDKLEHYEQGEVGTFIDEIFKNKFGDEE